MGKRLGIKPGRAALAALLALSAIGAAKGASAADQPSSGPPPPAAQPTPAPPDFGSDATGGWAGTRGSLQRAGITINAQWVLEGFWNLQGGLRTGTDWATTFDLNAALDTEQAFHWRGGELYVDLEDHSGRDPGTDLTGDLQGFDRLNSSDYLQIYECWYQQALPGGWLTLKAGKWDANDDFSVITNGLLFFNASDHVTPTLLPFPTTPDPMPGAAVDLTPGSLWYADFGAFDANRSDHFGDLYGNPQDVQPTATGTLLIGETGLRWGSDPQALDGDLKLGAWGHTGTFRRLDGGSQTGAMGCYAILDETLWRPSADAGADPGRGLRAFLAPGWTEAAVATLDRESSAGLTWTGPSAARPRDVLGWGADLAHIPAAAAPAQPYELAWEAFYQLQATAWAAFTPDLQYIVHPGGRTNGALVASLDATLQL